MMMKHIQGQNTKEISEKIISSIPFGKIEQELDGIKDTMEVVDCLCKEL